MGHHMSKEVYPVEDNIGKDKLNQMNGESMD